jgi:hypothetical protein
MSDRTPAHRARVARPRAERRSPRGKPGSLRWLRSLLGRPVALEQRNGKLHITLQERRRPPEVIQAQERAALCEELRLRLLEHGEHHVAVLRPLLAVHEALSRHGWERVGHLPSALLAKAHLQLLMLIGREASGALSGMAEHLRLLQAAAEAREDRNRRDGVRDDDQLVVVEEVEASVYEEADRAWVVTESPARVEPEVDLPLEPARR